MIFQIEGPPKSGKTTLANALRNHAILNQRGALLIDDTSDGEIKHVIEKLILAEPLKANQKVGDIKWKKDPIIVTVGPKGVARLKEIEAVLPGFADKFGPVTKLTLGKA